jgi:hypothetical protein
MRMPTAEAVSPAGTMAMLAPGQSAGLALGETATRETACRSDTCNRMSAEEIRKLERPHPGADASKALGNRRCARVFWGSQMHVARIVARLLLVLCACAPLAQAQAPAGSRHESGFDVLVGRWVRPDGGYTITIREVGTDGKLDAMYANPGRLPFSKAVATRDGKTIRLLFELTAGGYGGSTYALTYDRANDVLKGVYDQAVAREKFDVHFLRAK